jgi:endonuclease/exonuclease/phosphatase family metal-dependent hydrolase
MPDRPGISSDAESLKLPAAKHSSSISSRPEPATSLTAVTAPATPLSWRSRLIVWTCLGVTAGVVIRDGADRRPADVSRAIAVRLPSATPVANSTGAAALVAKIMPRPAGDSNQAAGRTTLRLASFNIHSGKGGDEVRDLRRTATVLNSGLDFAGLNEVRAYRWGEFPDQAAELGAALQLSSAFLPTERHWWCDHFGNAVLSRQPLEAIDRWPLPGTRGKAFRNVGVAWLRLETTTVTILTTHIDVADDRVPQLQQVTRWFLALQPPVVLMGDLNTRGNDPLLLPLLATPGVHSALHEGIAGGPPPDTIDWVFHRGLETVSANVVDVDASDHPIVFAELALPRP